MSAIIAKSNRLNLLSFDFFYLKKNKVFYFFLIQYALFLIFLIINKSTSGNKEINFQTHNSGVDILSQLVDFLSIFYFFSFVFPISIFWILYQKRKNIVSELLLQNGFDYLISEIVFVFLLYLIFIIPCLLILIYKQNQLLEFSYIMMFMKFYGTNLFFTSSYLIALTILSFLIKNRIYFFVFHFMNLTLFSLDESRFWAPVNWGITVFNFYEPNFRKNHFFTEYPPIYLITLFILIYSFLIIVLLKLITYVQTKIFK